MTARTAAWQSLANDNAELAENGHRLLYQDARSNLGGAFLATVSAHSTPRLHPVMPVLSAGELWLFIVQMSPKYRDLIRTQRFALHSLPTPAGGEEFAVQGHAEHIEDERLRATVVATTGGRQGQHEFEHLFRCRLSTALHTRWTDWGTPASWPSYAKWHS